MGMKDVAPAGLEGAREVAVAVTRAPGYVDPNASKKEFSTNKVVTSHYTMISFIPMNLFHQFHRAANIYFLLICFLQLFKLVSITGGVPTLAGPLAMVLTITALKDALEDYRRHVADDLENNRETLVRDETGKWVPREWQNIKVGDIIKCHNRESFAADMVALSCSDPNNLVYVMTANLDGETNLKLKKVSDEMPEDVNKIKGKISCDQPNKQLRVFTGSFTDTSGAQVALGPKNVLLRGCQLRNTAWVIGCVVYTGPQSKIQMCAAQAKPKISTMMQQANTCLVVVFATQVLLCLISAICAAVWISTDDVRNASYIWGADEAWNPGVYFVLRLLNYIIVFTSFIPISLLVTIDMVKFFQAFFFQYDLTMWYEAEPPFTSRRMTVRTSDLNEELGQIDYVFSDKTGTLTANIMNFRKCSINGVLYGKGTTEVGRGVLRRRGLPIPPEQKLKGVLNVNFVDPKLQAVIDNPDDPEYANAIDFMTHLAVNHGVMPEPQEDGSLMYSAASPDEGALVAAARYFGFTFNKREPKQVTVNVKGKDQIFPVTHVLDFSSKRKRSSVVIRQPDGSAIVYCKGADMVIIERLNKASLEGPLMEATKKHQTTMADDGLRVLLLAKAVITKERYEAWAKRYHEASVAMEGRKAKLEKVMDEIEQDMQLTGATAIEDKLQEGVSDAIACIRAAGVKVWMLTGDKVDTAVNIGFACALWTEEMHLVRVVGENEELDFGGGRWPTKAATEARLHNQLKEAQAQVDNGKEVCLVVDTLAIHTILENQLTPLFLEICERCKSVICARVSPDQKGEIVAAVRKSSPITSLAIGDGANDVPMIQRAHVGVGIYGQEGLQAVNSSDYAIAQFRFLKQLLLVHGRWSIRRTGIVVPYMFYKNALLVLPQWIFGFYNLASGQNFYLEYPCYQAFNVFYTALPIVAVGVFDQDLPMSVAQTIPKLYREGVNRDYFNLKLFARWQLEGYVAALILTLICIASLEYTGVTTSSGKNHGIWYLGSAVHFSVCAVSNWRLALETKSWNSVIIFCFALSFPFAWFTSILVWSTSFTWANSMSSVGAWGIEDSWSDGAFWMTCVLATGAAMIPAYVFKALEVIQKKPKLSQLCAEAVKWNYGNISPSN